MEIGIKVRKCCLRCKKAIKGKPLIFDDYYFCNNNNGKCKAEHIFGKEAESE